MNFSKIITIVLIAFVVGLIITAYLTNSNSFRDVKDDVLDKVNIDENRTTIVSDSRDAVERLKHRITYGSFDREIPVEVYFCPEDNCVFKLINLIDSSKKSIECAIYDISLDSITNKLIEKHNEGVEVTIVSDYERSKSRYSDIGILKYSKIPVITNTSDNPYMHNKFCVFDEKIVWVGSMNFTLNGNYKNNNNVLVFEDKEIAKEYSKKMDSFFKGEFSPEIKKEVDVKSFGNIENYFCPEDNCSYHLLRFLDDANYSLDCMLFSFTLEDAFNIINEKDIEKRFILEARNVSQYSQYENLVKNNIPVILDKNPNSMHHKFCIIDEYIVMTGSMNISKNGTTRNDESLIFVYNEELAKEYTDYFNNYWDLWNIE